MRSTCVLRRVHKLQVSWISGRPRPEGPGRGRQVVGEGGREEMNGVVERKGGLLCADVAVRAFSPTQGVYILLKLELN